MEEYEPLEDDALVVKESQPANIIIGSIFLLMLIVAVLVDGGFSKIPLVPLIGWFVFGTGFIWQGLRHQETMRIDCNGIYLYKKLLTDWPHFIEAQLDQKGIRSGSVRDRFVLILRYGKPGIVGSFKTVMPLANTQDQTEEDVLEAIRRCYTLSQGEVLPMQQPLQIGEG
jgi:hypothetical protein